MNFRSTLLLIITTLVSCGVKSPPTPPAETALPSIRNMYLEKLSPKQPQEKKDKEKAANNNQNEANQE